MTLLVNKEIAREIAWSGVGEEYLGLKIIENELIGTRGDFVDYCLIVQNKDGRFYRTFYSEGYFFTDKPNEALPFMDSEPDFEEVFPYEVPVTFYRTKEEADASTD